MTRAVVFLLAAWLLLVVGVEGLRRAPATGDVYASRMEGQGAEDRAYTEVVREALEFARSLKDNPHQYLVGDDGCETKIPVIDLSLDDDVVGPQLLAAATEWGFFQVVNHGLEQELIEDLFQANREFMGLDQPTKEESAFRRAAICGYEKRTQVHPSSGVPDLKENFLVCAREGAMEGLWPTKAMPDLEERCARFLEACHATGSRILRLLEAGLGMPEGKLTSCNTLWGPESKCVLRFLHYPPTTTDQPPHPDQWRAAPHTDFALLTLLFQVPGEGGLQCAKRRHHSRTVDATDPLGWHEVPPTKGAITCNIGDMLERWSSDRLVSNLHRVVLPASHSRRSRSRYSMAFFLQPDDSTEIDSDKYETCTAEEMVQGRVRAYWPATTIDDDR